MRNIDREDVINLIAEAIFKLDCSDKICIKCPLRYIDCEDEVTIKEWLLSDDAKITGWGKYRNTLKDKLLMPLNGEESDCVKGITEFLQRGFENE